MGALPFVRLKRSIQMSVPMEVVQTETNGQEEMVLWKSKEVCAIDSF